MKFDFYTVCVSSLFPPWPNLTFSRLRSNCIILVKSFFTILEERSSFSLLPTPIAYDIFATLLRVTVHLNDDGDSGYGCGS